MTLTFALIAYLAPMPLAFTLGMYFWCNQRKNNPGKFNIDPMWYVLFWPIPSAFIPAATLAHLCKPK